VHLRGRALHAPARPAREAASGFTLVELLIAFSLLGILLALALPSLATWSRNVKARSTAESLQNGLRLARSEAVRSSRQVMLSLTNANPTLGATAVANGRNWVVRTVPAPGEAARFVEGGSPGGLGSDVVVTGDQESICFNAFGRLVANATPGASTTGGAALPAGSCRLPASGSPVTYEVTANAAQAGVDRRYRLTVSLGGQIRLCDANRSLSTSPDGC
jgi:type IV fimbrial biogenesis protein FimT